MQSPRTPRGETLQPPGHTRTGSAAQNESKGVELLSTAAAAGAESKDSKVESDDALPCLIVVFYSAKKEAPVSVTMTASFTVARFVELLLLHCGLDEKEVAAVKPHVSLVAATNDGDADPDLPGSVESHLLRCAHRGSWQSWTRPAACTSSGCTTCCSQLPPPAPRWTANPRSRPALRVRCARHYASARSWPVVCSTVYRTQGQEPPVGPCVSHASRSCLLCDFRQNLVRCSAAGRVSCTRPSTAI